MNSKLFEIKIFLINQQNNISINIVIILLGWTKSRIIILSDLDKKSKHFLNKNIVSYYCIDQKMMYRK